MSPLVLAGWRVFAAGVLLATLGALDALGFDQRGFGYDADLAMVATGAAGMGLNGALAFGIKLPVPPNA